MGTLLRTTSWWSSSRCRGAGFRTPTTPAQRPQAAASLLLSCAWAQVDPEGLKDGEVLVELLYLSVDPYMRGRMINQKVCCPTPAHEC